MKTKFLTLLALLISLTTFAGPMPANNVCEFTSKENQQMNWEVVNDGVMGGLSKGKLEHNAKEHVTRFHGNLSLENYGGFSTFRSQKVNYDWSKSSGLILRVKGDGRTYQARLATDERIWGNNEVTFSCDFKTTKGEWVEIKVPFSKFKAGFRGQKLPDKKLNPGKIQRLGILLGDKKAGPFDLHIDWMRTYSE